MIGKFKFKLRWYWFNIIGLILLAGSNVAGTILRLMYSSLTNITMNIIITITLTGVFFTFVGFMIAAKKII